MKPNQQAPLSGQAERTGVTCKDLSYTLRRTQFIVVIVSGPSSGCHGPGMSLQLLPRGLAAALFADHAFLLPI